jgi:hypothetical protein
MRILAAVLCVAFAAPALAQTTQHPRDPQIHDADTLAWWHTTEALSGDEMEGRDTGSAAYQRAADYVAERFKAAGLQPAGDNGSYFQDVTMHQLGVDPKRTKLTVTRDNGSTLSIPFLDEFSVAPSRSLGSRIEGRVTFRGYCGKDAMQEIAGKFVLCFGTKRKGLPTGAERVANARAGGAAAIVNVDDPFFTIEPPRWPTPYARSVALGALDNDSGTKPGEPVSPAVLTLSEKGFTELLAGTPFDAKAILATGGKQQPLKPFDLPATLTAEFAQRAGNLSSPNVLAVLPGTDPVLKEEYVVISAHLDGYGYGKEVNGDRLYNGALDDAAYVALLIQFADDLHTFKKGTRRSILFCAFTGEEKGLLGSRYYIAHPTIPLKQTVADINLDQLRPLFPLHILTAEAIDDTSLGSTAREVGKSMQIELRPDREPERNLLARADQYPFLTAGVPAISFIFGFDPGTDAEARYREWYQVRYHRPQDDLTQPIDFDAATKFDQFFYKLTETIADQLGKPSIYPSSQFAKNEKKDAPKR